VINKQARSINRNDIALFLYVEPAVDATRFEANRTLPVRYGTCVWDEQRATARERRKRAVAGGERRANPRT